MQTRAHARLTGHVQNDVNFVIFSVPPTHSHHQPLGCAFLSHVLRLMESSHHGYCRSVGRNYHTMSFRASVYRSIYSLLFAVADSEVRYPLPIWSICTASSTISLTISPAGWILVMAPAT